MRYKNAWYLTLNQLQYKGYKLSALEIERVLQDYQGISEVAVVGIPDERVGQDLVAVIVPDWKECTNNAGLLTYQSFYKWAKEELPQSKIPSKVYVIGRPPKARRLLFRRAIPVDMKVFRGIIWER